MRRQNPEKDFYNVSMSKEDFEAYIEWTTTFQKTYKTRFHKGYLAELFRKGSNSIEELNLINKQHTHTCKNMSIGPLHRQVVNIINTKWGFEDYEEKENFKIVHNDLLEVIKDVFKLKDRRPTNERRDEILKLLDLQKIQEGNNYYIVHKTYIKPTKIKEIKEDNIISEVERIIKLIIGKGLNFNEGLQMAVITNQEDFDLEKNKDIFNLKCKENGIIRRGSEYILKSLVMQQNKLEAEKEADLILGVN